LLTTAAIPASTLAPLVTSTSSPSARFSSTSDGTPHQPLAVSSLVSSAEVSGKSETAAAAPSQIEGDDPPETRLAADAW